MTERYKMFTVAGLGALLATFETSSVNVALPSLAKHFDINLDTVSWVVLSYSLIIAPTLLLFAALASRIGFKKIYLTGFALFSVGSLVAGFSNDFTFLIVGRVIQGLGASMNISLGPAVIASAFPKGERGKGMGMIAMLVGVGLLAGPLLGGYLATVDWRLIFLAPLALSLWPFFLVPRIHSWRTPSNPDKNISPLSGAILFVAIGTFLYATKSINKAFVSAEVMYAFFGLSLAAVVVFLWRERNPEKHLIGYQLFRNRNFSVSMVLMFLAFVCTSSILVLVPFYVERQLGLSAREAGMFLAITPVLMFFFAPVSGRVADKIGARIPGIIGLGLLALGVYFLRDVTPADGIKGLIIPLVTFGIGLGIFGTPNSSDMMGSVSEEMRGIASGALSTTRSLSMTFGVAVSAALYVHSEKTVGPIEAYHYVFTLALVAALLAFGLSFFRESGKR